MVFRTVPIINPFCEYFPVKQNNLEYIVSNVFKPEISFKEKDNSLIALVKERVYTIFELGGYSKLPWKKNQRLKFLFSGQHNRRKYAFSYNERTNY